LEKQNGVGFSKWWVFLSIGVGSFMAALDGSVVNVALPVIKNIFGNTAGDIQWVASIYLLVVSGTLLTFGRLGDLRSHKWIYLSGFVIFVLSSAVCGAAPDLGWLVGARAVQAIGAAMLFANGPAILTRTFPASERGRALGLQAMMTYLGLVVGPSLGGWLITQFFWRAVFYINVPVGALALALGAYFIVADPPAERPTRFDFSGAFLFMAGLGALVFGLNKGGEVGWNSPLIWVLLGGALILLIVFVRWERIFPDPMLDLNLFKARIFSAAALSAVLNYICLYAVIFLLPFYLIQGRGLRPDQAGLILTAQPLIMVIAAPLSGNLSDRLGSRLLSTAGMLVLAGGLFGLSSLNAETPFGLVSVILAVIGLGVGLFSSPNNSALMGAAPRPQQGVAGGVLATARNVGMSLGVALAGAIFNTVYNSMAAGGVPNAAFYQGIQISMMVAAGVALLGALTSSVRGSGTAVPSH